MQKTWVRVLTTLMTLCVMGMIFFFSTESAPESDATSGRFSTWLADRIRPAWRQLPEPERTEYYNEVQHVVRKVAHFTEFALLGFCLRICLESWAGRRKGLTPAAWAAGTLYAGLDELHQLLADGRSGQWSDVAIDSAGVLCGALLMAGLLLVLERRGRFSRTAGCSP